MEFTARPHQRCINCCGCFAAILLIMLTIILILLFTVFAFKDPVIEMDSVRVDGLDVLNRSTNFRPGLNLTVLADVSVKNPNIVASFKFDNTTTYVYYAGSVVGEFKITAGQAGAHSILGMNVSSDFMVDQILRVPRFGSDWRAGIFPLHTFTRISGKVEFTEVIKTSVVVKLNCTMNVNISSQAQAGQDRSCRRHVLL